MLRVAKGYIEQLPSGSFRVSVYVGTDPITRRQIRLKATVKTEQQAQIELGRLLKDASEGRGVAVPGPKPALVGADGRRVEVPGPVFDALVQVATAMAHGQGVTVIPQNALLTTQEAAELLGISRPTLVRLVEDGEIPYEQRGRHRRVMLADLLAYQASMRRERREALDRMAQEGQAAGLYDATAGQAEPQGDLQPGTSYEMGC